MNVTPKVARQCYSTNCTPFFHQSSSLKLNVARIQSVKNNTLFITLRQCWTVPRCQTPSGYTAFLFIPGDRMPFLESTLDNADQLFGLVITPSFYLHDIEVADQNPTMAVYKQTP